MRLGDAIQARLLAIADLSALVESRVYELVLPQNEKRASVRFQVLGTPRPSHFRGPINHVMQRVQVDHYVPTSAADPIATVHAMGDAAIGNGLGPQASGLYGWAGVLGGSPDTPIHIFAVELTNDGDQTYEEDAILRIRLRQEYRVHWRIHSSEVSA